MSGIAPLAIWDANAREYNAIRDQVCEYLAGQGLPIDAAYRVEVYLLDAPFARVFTYDQDSEGGERRLDQATGDVAVRPPFDQLLTALPPDSIRVLT